MPHIRGHRNGGAGGPNRNQNNRNGAPTTRTTRRPNQGAGQHGHNIDHNHSPHQHYIPEGNIYTNSNSWATVMAPNTGSYQSGRSGIHQHTGQIGGRQTRRNMGSRNPRRGRRR